MGYAVGFKNLINYINKRIPKNEIIEGALRKTVSMFPELAIRELVANALIHQDFYQMGTNPMIEIFSDRMEITNCGKPLINVMRFLDSTPRSRNEKLATFMRYIGICEELGSGIDKVAIQAELFQLPAPLFEELTDFTKATLFAYKDFNQMNKDDKIRSCYTHCVLCHIKYKKMDNASLRNRFKLPPSDAAAITRIINWTLDANLIIVSNNSGSRKYKTYIPFWSGQ